MEKVIYSVGRMHIFVDVAAALQRKLAWEPVYWVTQENDGLPELVREKFPSVVCHPFVDLNRGIPLDGLGDLMYRGLGSDVLNIASRYEPIAMDLMDRMDIGRTFSYAERQSLYVRLLSYCMGVVRKFEIDVLVLNTTPHCMSDFMFFAACKILNKKVRMFYAAGIDMRLLVVDDIESLPRLLLKEYKNICEEESDYGLSEKVKAEIDKITSFDSGYDVWYMSKHKKTTSKLQHIYDAAELAMDRGLLDASSISLGEVVTVNKDKWPLPVKGASKGKPRGPVYAGLKRLLRFCLGCLRVIPRASVKRDISCTRVVNIFNRKFHEKYSRDIDFVLKRNQKPIEERLLSWWEYYTYRDWSILKKTKLKKIYESLAKPPDLGKPYIYMGLHYQPEKTTCPDGGRFSNQYLAAALISSALPAGWTLYIKENPQQFAYLSFGEMSRWEEYYEQFSRLGNVQFVPLDMNSRILISKSRAVATVTGTLGWEGLAFGKCALIFGMAWYEWCNGVYRIRTEKDIYLAMNEIISGKAPTYSDVYRYAKTIERNGRRCYSLPSHASQFEGATDQNQIDALAGLLVDFETGVSAGSA